MFDYNNGTAQSAADCYDEFANNFGITYGYYHSGPAPFIFPLTPFKAFVNLRTGIVVKKDSVASYIQDAEEIIAMMQDAHE